MASMPPQARLCHKHCRCAVSQRTLPCTRLCRSARRATAACLASLAAVPRAALGSLCTANPPRQDSCSAAAQTIPAIRVCASPQVVEIDGQRILLAEVDGAVKAVSNK